MARSRWALPKTSKLLQRVEPRKRMRRPAASSSTRASSSSMRRPRRSHSRRSAGPVSRISRWSYSWLPGTKSTGTGQPAKAARPFQVLSTSPASTSNSAPGAGWGSKASVSMWRSERICSFMRAWRPGSRAAPSHRSVGAVALLVLAARAARAGVVAADLGRLATHGLDLVAQVRGEVVQIGHVDHEVLDRVVDVIERVLAVERGDDVLLFRRLGRQVAVQARHGVHDAFIVQLTQLGEAQGRM